MASKIYEQIFQRLISQFVGAFSEDSDSIFKDERNKLIHPGEYGRYREEACKSILGLLLGKDVCISDGFVITSNDTISTQCDIIVYNSDVAPVVADGFVKMFPAEEVRMFGEVKSTLSRAKFAEALQKMAENKRKIICGRGGLHHCPTGRNAEVYNTVASFLICNKMNFDYSEIDFDEIYKDIDRQYWHNGILSIENATLIYALDFSRFPHEIKNRLADRGVNTNLVSSWEYPTYTQGDMIVNALPNCQNISVEDRYHHIKTFFAGMARCCRDVWIYSHDPAEYLGITMDSIFKDIN